MDALHHGVVPMGKVTHPTNVSAFYGRLNEAPNSLCQTQIYELCDNPIRSGDVCLELAQRLTSRIVQVKFSASTEYDMINNYKVLQNVFNKLNISKVRLGASLRSGSVSRFHCLSTVFFLQSIDVNKLIKGKPLDNMEFMQWLKSHFDKVTAGQGVPDYNGPGRRSQTKGGPAASRAASGAPPRPANTKYDFDAFLLIYIMTLYLAGSECITMYAARSTWELAGWYLHDLHTCRGMYDVNTRLAR